MQVELHCPVIFKSHCRLHSGFFILFRFNVTSLMFADCVDKTTIRNIGKSIGVIVRNHETVQHLAQLNQSIGQFLIRSIDRTPAAGLLRNLKMFIMRSEVARFESCIFLIKLRKFCDHIWDIGDFLQARSKVITTHCNRRGGAAAIMQRFNILYACDDFIKSNLPCLRRIPICDVHIFLLM